MAEGLLQPIRELFSRRRFVGVGDRDLLRRFTQSRDEDAFAELVRRHSTVVWRVCQSILPRPDAEDAFQASFVVLARKAGHLDGHALAGWLSRVAYRISIRAWKSRRRHASTTLSVDPPAPDDGLVGWRELQTVLQTELAQLPEKYRETLLLCGVEGCSKSEVAVRLAIPVGTVSSRLAAAREMLRQRLTRRGIEVPLVFAALSLGAKVSAGTIHRAAEVALRTGAMPGAIARMVDHAFGGLIGLKATCFGAVTAVLLVGGSLVLGNKPTPPPDDPKPVAVEGEKPLAAEKERPDRRADAGGDPLPPEVLHRFGSARFSKGEAFRITQLSHDGKRLASMGSGGIYVWDLRTGRILQQFPPMWHPGQDKGHLCFVDGDRRLVVSSRWQSSLMIATEPKIESGELARVWDIESGKLVRSLRNQLDTSDSGPGGIWPIEEGKKFVSISTEQSGGKPTPKTVAIVWDAATLGELERHTSDTSIDTAVDYSPAKDCFLCLRFSDPNRVRRGHELGEVATLLDRKSGKELWTSEKEDWTEAKFGFSSDGSRLVMSREKKLQLLTVATKRIESLKASPPRWGSHPTFLPDGKSILYTENRSLNQIEADPEAVPRKRATVPTGFYFHLLPGGKGVVGTDRDDVLREFDLSTGEEAPREASYRGGTKVACQRRGPLVAVTDMYGKLDLWNSEDGKLVRSLRPGRPSTGQPAFDLKFSPDDRILASATTAGAIDLWSVADGKLLHSIPVGKDEKDKVDGADYVQFSSDGKRLYFLPRDRHTACVEVQTGKRVEPGPLWGEFGMIVPTRNQVLMPNGAIGDLTGGKEVGKLSLPIRTHWDLFKGNFSADGRRLAGVKSGENGFHACVWEVGTGQELMQSESLLRFGKMVVRLHPDGKWLTALVEDGTLRTWEVATGQQVYRIDGLNYHVWQRMELGPHGRSALPSNELSPMLYSLRPLDTPKEFGSALWDQLSEKPAVAYRAQWAMLDHPEKAIALLREKLPAETSKRERAWFDGLVGKLDSPAFKTREATQKELQEAITEIPAEWIQETLKNTGSDEVRNRLTKFLEEHGRTQQVLRPRIDRAVQVAEMLDTPAAHRLLEEWSKGAGISNLKDAAMQARGRLGLE